jgi:chloramphenicol O-acetyltransferase type B
MVRMDLAQCRRLLRRIHARALGSLIEAGVEDPITGELIGILTPEEAVAAGRAVVGPHTYGPFRLCIGKGERWHLEIGDYCSIADGVQFGLGGNHRVDWVSTYPFRIMFGLPGAWQDGHPRPEGDIVVGNDVWLGTDALIMPGVRIGDGAVVTARAVVTRDVAPYAIVGGLPAREIRRRFSPAQIEGLLALRWWDWPEATVREHVELLASGDVERLLAVAPISSPPR